MYFGYLRAIKLKKSYFLSPYERIPLLISMFSPSLFRGNWLGFAIDEIKPRAKKNRAVQQIICVPTNARLSASIPST